MPCHITPCHYMPCHAMSHHAMSLHAMPRNGHVTSCHVMSCHAISYHISYQALHILKCPTKLIYSSLLTYAIVKLYWFTFTQISSGKLIKTLNSSCLENLYISICKIFSKMFLSLQSYKNRTKATCPLKYSFFKVSYSCQHFPLTVSKNNIRQLDCIIKILYHIKMWVYEIWNAYILYMCNGILVKSRI